MIKINYIEQIDLKQMKLKSPLVNSVQRKNFENGASRDMSGNIMAKPALTLRKTSVPSCWMILLKIK